MNPLRYLENRIRGWLPKEPVIPRNQTKIVEISEEDRRKNQWKISVANAIMVGTFLGLRSLIDPFNENIEYAVTSWIIFILSVISVNFLLYRYFNRKTTSQLEKLRQ
jgi:uncharacterized membrane protein